MSSFTAREWMTYVFLELSDPVAVQKAVQEALGANQDAAELPGQLSLPASNAV